MEKILYYNVSQEIKRKIMYLKHGHTIRYSHTLKEITNYG